jgi:hypothetical protein
MTKPTAQGHRAVVVKTQKGDLGSASSRIIDINDDVSSVMFLHACAKEAVNRKAYDMIYNFDDSAEMLGWYELLYEDGLVVNIPIRYGVNILDWRWQQRLMKGEKEKAKYSQNKYAYCATAVQCSNDKSRPVTLFAFEWENARYGKKIKSISLKSVDPAKGNDNAIMLLALSVTEKKKATEAKGTEAQ